MHSLVLARPFNRRYRTLTSASLRPRSNSLSASEAPMTSRPCVPPSSSTSLATASSPPMFSSPCSCAQRAHAKQLGNQLTRTLDDVFKAKPELKTHAEAWEWRLGV